MLKRGSKKGVEIPYLINDVYINEHNNGYYYDLSSTNDLEKIVPDNKIRVTFDHWNLYRPITCNYVKISELYPTCIYRKIIYEYRSLINVCASVTMPTKLLTGPVTHFGKISGIYFNENEGNLFLVSYNKDQYDLVSEDYLDILFKDRNDENNFRKHKVKSPKLTKQLLLRYASKKDSGDDGLKAKKTKKKKKSMDHVVSTKLSEYKLIVIFF